MMSARLLKHVPEENQNKFFRASGHFFDRVIAEYAKWLNWVLDRQKLTLIVAVGTIVVTPSFTSSSRKASSRFRIPASYKAFPKRPSRYPSTR